MTNIAKLRSYIQLLRLDKPIGILLLLWPTLWALWLAKSGVPPFRIATIFIAGVILMRSAGCVVNDYADRKFDAHVARTASRPLATGAISAKRALWLAASLSLIAFALVLQCNVLTIALSVVGLLLACIYPFLKRITHLPQLGLGFAFSWGIVMAFAAVQNHIPAEAWLLYAAAVVWPVIYDTFYALVDREDDLKVGVKSTAILYHGYEYKFIACLQVLFLGLMLAVGYAFSLSTVYYVALCIVAILFKYQLGLLRQQNRAAYFQAFKNNNYVGMILFLALVWHFL